MSNTLQGQLLDFTYGCLFLVLNLFSASYFFKKKKINVSYVFVVSQYADYSAVLV